MTNAPGRRPTPSRAAAADSTCATRSGAGTPRKPCTCAPAAAGHAPMRPASHGSHLCTFAAEWRSSS
eukprot:5986786-Pyramimonas_sp.AAC.1